MAAPPCVGTYELNHTSCDGDPRGATEQDRAACAWRNRCRGLQYFCDENDRLPEDMVAGLSYDQLVSLCEQEFEALQNGDTEPPPSKKSHKRPGKRTVGRGKWPRLKGAQITRRPIELGERFSEELRRLLPDALFAKGNQVLARPGIMFVTNRYPKLRYFSWYCTSGDGGRPIAIARVDYLFGIGRVNVHFPVAVETLERVIPEDQRSIMNPRVFNNGAFRSSCARLDEQGIVLAAAVVRRLMDNGDIWLPSG